MQIVFFFKYLLEYCHWLAKGMTDQKLMDVDFDTRIAIK